MDYVVLRAELLADPLIIGYAAMNDTQAAASLNTANRPVNVQTLDGAQIYEAIDATEFAALLTTKQEVVDIIHLGPNILVAPGSKARARLAAIFGGGSATVTALAALGTKTVSRATELGLGVVNPGHVMKARA